MKKTEVHEFHEILKKTDSSVEEFCEATGVPPKSFQVQTVSTAKVPKWIKAFVYGFKLKNKK